MKIDLLTSQDFLTRIVCLCGISCFFSVSNINAAPAQQNDPSVGSGTETRNDEQQSQPWESPPPPPDDFDWIQLKSGEWLKGELKGGEKTIKENPIEGLNRSKSG